jgi:hypothetical protein
VTTYDYSEVRGEISGFGGDYEQCCRAMVLAGLAWLDAHPDAAPTFRGFKNVFGFIDSTNEDGKALESAVVDGCEQFKPGAGGPTGAMVQACVGTCMFVREHGWPAYVEKMNALKDSEEEPNNER